MEKEKVVCFFKSNVSQKSYVSIDLSIFSLLLKSAVTPFAVELLGERAHIFLLFSLVLFFCSLVWIPVTYITVCVFHSLFSVRVLHYYRFLPGERNELFFFFFC